MSVLPSQLYVPHLYTVSIADGKRNPRSETITYNSQAAGEKPLRIWKIL